MSTHLYKVTLTDLGIYTLTVAADSEREAQSIAKTVLSEDAMKLPADMRAVSREIEAKAEIDTDSMAEAREYRVVSCYSVDFELNVPARDRTEASRHARRLYDEYYGPFEFTTSEPRLAPFVAMEAQP